MKINSRVRRAYDVLNKGGYWRNTVERTFTGDQYVTRLHNRWGDAVKGVGSKTFDELRSMDLLVRHDCAIPFEIDAEMFQDWLFLMDVTHPDQLLTLRCDMNAAKRSLKRNFAEEWKLKGAA